ncbi:MAG: hypothetical protein ACLPY5_14195 [Candidatus Bathyarchaeia archaeon]
MTQVLESPESHLFVADNETFLNFTFARCLTCLETPEASPCWHDSPIKLNPKITLVRYEVGFGWFDFHHHSHRGHVLMPVTIQPTMIVLSGRRRASNVD